MNQKELQVKVDACFIQLERGLAQNGQFIPMIDIEMTDDSNQKFVMPVAMAVKNDEELRKLILGLGLCLGGIKQIGKIKEINCIVMLSEGYFMKVSKEEYEKIKNTSSIKPSSNIDRREMLLAIGLSDDGSIAVKAKEKFTVEVKGKNIYSLSEVSDMKSIPTKESYVPMLKTFFDGVVDRIKGSERYKIDHPEDYIRTFTSMHRKDKSLNDVLDIAIEHLMENMGGNFKHVSVKRS